MTKDFGSFIILYCLICLGFALVGNINFVTESLKFESFRESLLTVVDASLGNFKFELIDEVEPNPDITLDIVSDGKKAPPNTTPF